MVVIIPKLQYCKIFGCPHCKKRFYDLRQVNIHCTKSHPEKKTVLDFTKDGRRVLESRRFPAGKIRIKTRS